MSQKFTHTDEKLQAENSYLLDELEMAYRQMEGILSVSDLETQIAYQELRSRNEELQRRLSEIEQAHAQLKQAQRMLVHSERMSAMGQMASAIIHEINNPLAVISGHLELLLKEENSEDHEFVFTAMHRGTQRLKDLTRNILTFSRRKHAEVIDLNLNSVCDDLLMFFLPLTREIDLRTSLDYELPEVRGDAAQIEQVITNLLVNALDATRGVDRGQIEISTGVATPSQLASEEAERGRSVFRALNSEENDSAMAFAEVRDNGPGIAVDAMAAIFEAFFTTKDENVGTGLGLAICRSIADSCRGEILLASKVGEGTSFRFFLPLS